MTAARALGICFFGLATVAASRAQTIVPGSKAGAHAPPMTAGEASTSRAFEAARKLGAPELYAFLKPAPKGGDLHMHLSGAVYAETFIDEAVREGLCIAPPPPSCTVNSEPDAKRTQTPPAEAKTPRNQSCPVPVLDAKMPPLPLSFATPGGGGCPAGDLPASEAFRSQPLYDALVDSFSMRGYVPTPGITGHDQFFATFARFGGLKAMNGEWVNEVATRAAAQNEQYLEVMNTPTFAGAIALAHKTGWPAGAEKNISPEQLAVQREKLLAAGLRAEVPVDRAEFADAVKRAREDGHCDAVPVNGRLAHACDVQIRFLYQVLRANEPAQVFAQTLLGFEVAQAEIDSGHPLVVGINFVQPEDARLAMRDYHLQMQMMDYLHSVYPKVRISLHAGELAFGMVPPDGMSFHIREAVELGHAERIGHGMDVLYEDRPDQLLKEMHDRHIDVEVNLTSNDVILGQTRTDHPLAAYRAAGVPVSLATDDEGVSRIDLTHEWVKGAEEQNLTYVDLKRSARNSLEHSFLRGASLWAIPDDYGHRVSACAAAITAAASADSACTAFLKTSERAQQQWELERRFAAFEAQAR